MALLGCILPEVVLTCFEGAGILILRGKENNSKTSLPKTLWLKLWPNEIFLKLLVSLSEFKQRQPKITQVFTLTLMT